MQAIVKIPDPISAVRSSRPQQVRSIALIEPLGDYGIGGYTHELAEAIACTGRTVHVYTTGCSIMQGVPRVHRCFPVLGSPLFKQRELLSGTGNGRCNANSVERSHSFTQSSAGKLPPSPFKSAIRRLALPTELALHLKRVNYDLVWTQWPEFDDYGSRFWTLSRALGLRLVHTVHNVLPHEVGDRARAAYGNIYRRAEWLIVHSEYARRELIGMFPSVDSKVIVSRHGLYSMFPRIPEVRERVRGDLGIGKDQPVLFFFGGVRPYKNVDVVLHALARSADRDAVLIVSGMEKGYPDSFPEDPLGRTRRLVGELGLQDRVRLLAQCTDITQTSELFEAADILVLPFLKSYGSGSLLLGMTFGKYILATRTGGMEEYLAAYRRCKLLDRLEVDYVARAVDRAISSCHDSAGQKAVVSPELAWSMIAERLIGELERRMEGRVCVQ